MHNRIVCPMLIAQRSGTVVHNYITLVDTLAFLKLRICNIFVFQKSKTN